ncbi:MAG: ferredoxin--NADP reductase [Vicinamibacterales bacterium]
MSLHALPAREVVRATPRTRIIRLDTGGEPFGFAAGQAVMAGLQGSPLRKPYSIASAPGDVAATGLLELLVQVDESGAPDPHLERALPGTMLDIDGPFGRFTLDPLPEGRPVLFVAGGTGIAPLRAMLRDLLSRPAARRISLAYSARAVDEFAYRDELEALADAGRLDLRLTLTRPDAGWPGLKGRVDQRLLESLLPGGPRCYLCGPPAFVADAAAMLIAAGVPTADVVVDDYSG